MRKQTYDFPVIVATLESVTHPRERLKIFQRELQSLQQYPQDDGGANEWRREGIRQLKAAITEAEIGIAELDRMILSEMRMSSVFSQTTGTTDGPEPVFRGRTITTGVPDHSSHVESLRRYRRVSVSSATNQVANETRAAAEFGLDTSAVRRPRTQRRRDTPAMAARRRLWIQMQANESRGEAERKDAEEPLTALLMSSEERRGDLVYGRPLGMANPPRRSQRVLGRRQTSDQQLPAPNLSGCLEASSTSSGGTTTADAAQTLAGASAETEIREHAASFLRAPWSRDKNPVTSTETEKKKDANISDGKRKAAGPPGASIGRTDPGSATAYDGDEGAAASPSTRPTRPDRSRRDTAQRDDVRSGDNEMREADPQVAQNQAEAELHWTDYLEYQ